jgi:hypothetical protein
MDNPVEADAKWKGKIVDVEFELQSLHIITLEENAALETLRNELWGPLWQRALFIFRGEARRQLVGLQHLSGPVIIRGKCKGLDSSASYATFDDCQFIRKPHPGARTDAGAQTAEGVTPTSGSLSFDATDLDRTVEWATFECGKLAKESANAIRYQTIKTELNDSLRGHVGKQIHWSLIVSSITEGDVVLRDAYSVGARDPAPNFFGSFSGELVIVDENETGATLQAKLALSVGKGITRERASKLNPKDKLPITGKVVRLLIEDSLTYRAGIRVTLTLKGLRAD